MKSENINVNDKINEKVNSVKTKVENNRFFLFGELNSKKLRSKTVKRPRLIIPEPKVPQSNAKAYFPNSPTDKKEVKIGNVIIGSRYLNR